MPPGIIPLLVQKPAMLAFEPAIKATMTSATELKLVREYDGLKVSLHPLQGLWTEEQYCERL